mmetsp:Transcript_37463/g.75601  ORF Transcript_37463/g.75601 Transcript_37463/m.75601 type:complete len:85 (+) Transcript_37463:332-586(+)
MPPPACRWRGARRATVLGAHAPSRVRDAGLHGFAQVPRAGAGASGCFRGTGASGRLACDVAPAPPAVGPGHEQADQESGAHDLA